MVSISDGYRAHKERRAARKLAQQRAWRAFGHGREEYEWDDVVWTGEMCDRLQAMVDERAEGRDD